MMPSTARHLRSMVPAYFGPWEVEQWAALERQRPAAVIVNPANGPGQAEVAGYRALADRFSTQGTEVFGYVATGWLARSPVDIAEDVSHYADWYGVKCVFFDEIPNQAHPGRGTVLNQLRSLRGGARTVFNCGQPVPVRWYRTVPDVRFGTFEGPAEGLHRSAFAGPPQRQVHLVHSVSPDQRNAVLAALGQRQVAFACVTEDALPNPWDVCPPELQSDGGKHHQDTTKRVTTIRPEA